MKFIIDEQLPFLLAEWLQSKGYDAIHVSSLSTGNQISDSFIFKYAGKTNGYYQRS
nr:DUF5615 family PIN-like protein [Arsenicibacter rosenii]